MRRLLAILFVLMATQVWAADGPNGSWVKETYASLMAPQTIAGANLRVRTDSSGNLLISNAAGSGQGPLTPLANIALKTDSSGNLLVSCSNCATAPLTLAQADGAQTLLFSTATYTVNMSSLPTFSIIATENTSAGTHDYLKMAITKTAGNFNFLNFLGGAAGATSEFSVDSTGNVTAPGTFGCNTSGSCQAQFQTYFTPSSNGANAKQFDSSSTRGSSNTGSNAVSAFDLSHTLNTSGVPSVFKLAVTDTAHGSFTKLWELLGGAAGTTSMASVGLVGTAPSTSLMWNTGSSIAVSASKSANFTVWSYTPPATAGQYQVQCNLTTTSGTNTGTLQITLDYVDSQGTVHTADIIPLQDATGTWATTKSGASKEFYSAVKMFSINNSATAIVPKAVITGTVAYTVGCTMNQVQ